MWGGVFRSTSLLAAPLFLRNLLQYTRGSIFCQALSCLMKRLVCEVCDVMTGATV